MSVSIGGMKGEGMVWLCDPKSQSINNKCVADLEAKNPKCKVGSDAWNKATNDQRGDCLREKYQCAKYASQFATRPRLMNLDMEEYDEEPTFALLLL